MWLFTETLSSLVKHSVILFIPSSVRVDVIGPAHNIVTQQQWLKIVMLYLFYYPSEQLSSLRLRGYENTILMTDDIYVNQASFQFNPTAIKTRCASTDMLACVT